jgi:BTB/POZ domain-containing protein 9
MADSHELRSNSFSSNSSLPSGEVDHVELLSSQLGALLHSSEFTDVTFIVEDKKFQAHRVFLASRCEYFRALLFGGMRESKPEAEIVLNEISAQSFGTLLKYLYTGRIFLRDLNEEHVLDLLGLAHKYGFLALESAISGYLKGSLDLHNICRIFDVACLYQLEEVLETCLNFADVHAVEILQGTADFASLSDVALVSIIKRDSFCAPEVDIFRAVQCWIGENPEADRQILCNIRLPLIKLPDLFHTVRPSGLFTADAILDAIKIRTESRVTEMNYRGHLGKVLNCYCHWSFNVKMVFQDFGKAMTKSWED